MLTWARRHLPEALLIPSAIGAGAVTVLSDIDEVVPWGHELGIGVSQLAFAYVGAYIFNWLIVERPRARALRGYYAAAFSSLTRLVFQSTALVHTIYVLAGSMELPTEPVRAEDIRDMLRRIDWGRLRSEGLDPVQPFAAVVDQHREAHRSVVPVLTNFEPAVAVAIARLDAAGVHRFVDRAKRNNSVLMLPVFQEEFVRYVYEYQQAGQELRLALQASRYTPDYAEQDSLLQKAYKGLS